MVDLHCHSTTSDGALSPTKLVREAKKCGLKYLALTDHDTIDGFKEAYEEGKKIGVEVIPSIEISASYKDRDIHVLGYFLDINDDIFLNKIREITEERINRTHRSVKLLNENRIDITYEDVANESDTNFVGRLHIAKALIKRGTVFTIKEAFEKYLGDGKLAYIPKSNISASEAIKLISNNGGVPVIAHPHLISLPEKEKEILIENFINEGLKGIECYYPKMKKEDKTKWVNFCKKHNLITTGGSDFHGLNREGIELNILNLSEEIYHSLRKIKKGK